MDGWMDGSQYHETRGGITLLLWLNLLWNRVERKGREGVSDGRDITNFCKMLPNSPVPWPRGIYIYIYIQWLNFLVALPWRRVISIGNLNKGFKERSLVVRPLPVPPPKYRFSPGCGLVTVFQAKFSPRGHDTLAANYSCSNISCCLKVSWFCNHPPFHSNPSPLFVVPTTFLFLARRWRYHDSCWVGGKVGGGRKEDGKRVFLLIALVWWNREQPD